MKLKSRPILILTILFGYILLQFISWEILFVRKTDETTELRQKLLELSVSDPGRLQQEINLLHEKKKKQVIMIVGEGTVFLLLLLFGIYKIKQAHTRELELTNQQKNFFLSITHELKTPIAATKLQLQTLQKHKLNEEQQKELLLNALNETERLNSLIDNVLFASRMETTEFKTILHRENISEMTRNILSRYYKTQLEKQELTVRIEENVHCLLAAQAYHSILTNLVDNAFKYSFDKKHVQVEIFGKNSKAFLVVSDEGTGIPDSDKKNIFRKFYRAGNEETRRAKGTGLGLYIVSFLVKQHKAEVSIKDNKPRGSVFEVCFNKA